jgi:hypothetical protein
MIHHQYTGLDSGLAQATTASSSGLTSVDLSMPSTFSVTGAPLTANGTMTVAWAAQPANRILAGPSSGGDAAPAFRTLVAADIPSLDAGKITTGVMAAARLGTGSPSSANFLRGDGTWATPSVSPAGSSTHVQYNNGGLFAGSANFTYNGTTLVVTQNIPGNNTVNLTAGGASATALQIVKSSDTGHPAVSITGASQTNNGILLAGTTSSPLLTAFLAYTGGAGAAGCLGTSSTAGIPGLRSQVNITNDTTTQPVIIGQRTGYASAPVAGYGAALYLNLATTGAPAGIEAGAWAVAWSTATHASRSAYHVWMTVHNGSALTERMRLTSDGILRLGSATVYFGLRPAATGTPVWTMPAADGTTGQVLTTNGAGILSWATPAGGYTDPLTTDGDVLIRSGGITTRLGVGTAGQVLTVVSGLPAWATPSSGFADPLTTDGDIIYRNTTTTRLAIGTSGQFLRVSGGLPTWQTVTLYADPLTTNGDVLIRSGGVTTRLGIGTAGQVLTVVSGLPAWATPSSGFADPLTTDGDIIYRNTTTTRLAVGTSGQFLRVSGGLPTWQTVTLYADPLTTNGDVVIRSGGVTTRLGIGTAGQVLTVVSGLPAWATPSSGFADPLTTDGDIIYRNTTTTRLAIGTSGQFLRVSGGLPTWQTVTLYADPLTTDGDILTRTTTTTRLAIGTSGQFLRVVAGLPAWQTVTLYTDPLTTNGDVLIRSGGVTTRLGIGTTGQVLTVVSGLPAWATPSSGFADPLTTDGDIIYRNTTTTRLAVGTSGQFLRVSGGLPTWQTVTLYADPLTTDGDVVIRSGGVSTRLGIGTTGQVLTVVSGLPAWATPSSGFADPLTTDGDIIYRNTTTTRLAVGTSGQFLRVSGGLPTWQTVTLYADPLTTDGDIVTRNTTTTRLAIGTSGQFLRVVAGLPAWQTVTLYTDPLTTNGDIVVRSGGVTTRLGIGTTGQVLTVVSGLPAWAAAPTTAPAGSDTQIQFNNAGAFGADSNFIWNNTAKAVGLGTSTLDNARLRIVAGDAYALYATAALTSEVAVARIQNTTSGNTAPALYLSTAATSSSGRALQIEQSRGTGIEISITSTALANNDPVITGITYGSGPGLQYQSYFSSSFAADVVQGIKLQTTQYLTTAANGHGIGIDMRLASSTGATQQAGGLQTIWSDATNATRTSYISLLATNNATYAETARFLAAGILDLRNAAGALRINGTKVIGPRVTGWQDPSGTLSRSTFVSDSVTVDQLAARLAQLILDLKGHGLIGS